MKQIIIFPLLVWMRTVSAFVVLPHVTNIPIGMFPCPSNDGVVTASTRSRRTCSPMFMSTPTPDPERMKQIMEEEARNPENMKASAQMLKNLKPSDIDNMMREMDSMPAAQKRQLEAMGMNPDMMRQSMEMMKANPQMATQMANMMETMTPEEMMEKSRQAQQAQSAFANANASMSSPTPPSVVEAELVEDEDDEEEEEDDDDDDEEDEESEPIPPPEAEILDTLYRTAELMSNPPTGKVTLAGFSTIPPIALLIGNDKKEDLSRKELRECWADGSLGATRVDRAGFERVWVEVQEYFWQPMMDKAREKTNIVETGKRKRGKEKPKAPASVVPVATSSSASPSPSSSSSVAGPQVGQNISPEQLEQQVKNMSDSDMDMMLDQMKSVTPEQEARMRAMGVDPAMMKKTAEVMNSNPLMKNAAKMMMKNMSAEQMKKASQQAQEQMSKMSPEEIKAAMDKLDKGGAN